MSPPSRAPKDCVRTYERNGVVGSFVDAPESHNGDRNQIRDVSCDMSPAFIKGVEKFLPEANITFDKSHIVRIINDAADKVRGEEVATRPILINTRYSLLKNQKKLLVASGSWFFC